MDIPLGKAYSTNWRIFFLLLFSFVESNINVLYSGASFISIYIIPIDTKIQTFWIQVFFYNSLTLPIKTNVFYDFSFVQLNQIQFVVYFIIFLLYRHGLVFTDGNIVIWDLDLVSVWVYLMVCNGMRNTVSSHDERQ